MDKYGMNIYSKYEKYVKNMVVSKQNRSLQFAMMKITLKECPIRHLACWLCVTRQQATTK